MVNLPTTHLYPLGGAGLNNSNTVFPVHLADEFARFCVVPYISDDGLRLVVKISMCSAFNVYEFQGYWTIITRYEKRTPLSIMEPNEGVPAE